MTDIQKWKKITFPTVEEQEKTLRMERECAMRIARLVSKMAVSSRSAEHILGNAIGIIRATAGTQNTLEILGDVND